MSYKAISHKGQSSDIFFTKDNNQPPQTVNQRQNNKSSLFSSQPETQQK